MTKRISTAPAWIKEVVVDEWMKILEESELKVKWEEWKKSITLFPCKKAENPNRTIYAKLYRNFCASSISCTAIICISPASPEYFWLDYCISRVFLANLRGSLTCSDPMGGELLGKVQLLKQAWCSYKKASSQCENRPKCPFQIPTGDYFIFLQNS